MTKRNSLLSIFVLIVMVTGVRAQEGEATPSMPTLPPPMPTIDWDLNPYAFPHSLHCQYIDTSAYDGGPTWGQIHIGQTSLNELDDYLESLSEAYETAGLRGSWVQYTIPNARQAEAENLPEGIRACILDDTVWLVRVFVLTDNPEHKLFIEDLVDNYGIPDVVTWSERLKTRLAFWFEHGIVVEFVIVDSIGLERGEIFSVVYIPYQEVENFENRWPYNRTRTSPPPEGDEIFIPPLPTEQNPVDFEAMVATMTAEPTDQKVTPTQIPIDTSMKIPFPSLDCPDIETPFAGPTWNGITIGSSTLSNLRDYISELSPNYSENSVASLQITEFTVRSAIAQAEGIPALISACVNPEDEKISAIYVPTRFYQLHIQDLVTEFGVPEIVTWDELPDSRVVTWLTEGVAASVRVDQSEQFVPYGTITVMVYFPYQSLEGYEERWPYTHRASSKAELVTSTPELPYITNPFDFEAMVATMTAEPSRAPTPIATESVWLQADDGEAMGAILRDSLKLGATCTDSPCLFGQSLRDMDFDNVDQLIGHSDLRDAMILLGPHDGSVSWIWSAEMAPTLGIDFYPDVLKREDYAGIASLDATSGIGFYNDEAYVVHLYFITDLGTLVDTYGEPLFATPRTYDYYGNMDIIIVFPDVEGYFIARTRCKEAELTATTRIVGHLSTLHQPSISDDSIEWHGYTDDLPDCSIFQP